MPTRCDAEYQPSTPLWLWCPGEPASTPYHCVYILSIFFVFVTQEATQKKLRLHIDRVRLIKEGKLTEASRMLRRAEETYLAHSSNRLTPGMSRYMAAAQEDPLLQVLRKTHQEIEQKEWWFHPVRVASRFRVFPWGEHGDSCAAYAWHHMQVPRSSIFHLLAHTSHRTLSGGIHKHGGHNFCPSNAVVVRLFSLLHRDLFMGLYTGGVVTRLKGWYCIHEWMLT